MGRDDGRRPPATLQDVAREAGVSLATASRSLNGSARKVREDYRARVLAAAERLNYAPNLQAQAVARGRTSLVGIIVSDITDPYFAQIAGGVIAAAEAGGLVATIGVSGRDPEREVQLVAALRGQRPTGIVLVGSRVADAAVTARLEAQLRDFENEGGHAVLVSQAGLPFDTIAFDNEDGARALARRLGAAGYANAVVLAGPEPLSTSRERTEGFLDGYASTGHPRDAVAVVHSRFTRDGGYEAMGAVLESGPRPDVVFAVNDVMAVGAMARLRAAGLEPGRDVAVAGFDDIETLRDVSPGLTTVRLPLEQGGATAVDLILKRASEPCLVSLPGEIVIRASTPGPAAEEA
ncbi:LacI family DNA-binding transcriptional regulator [Gryllotalpicola kribbensis]|jgi:LacI family transcriptional regulator|uniref:LacI family DNA-binding transcriptional regulator n=1 Tax=Gryllotalpicola kribbensis TaxID=993084 RepID=A0ABP8B0K2_9MICO